MEFWGGHYFGWVGLCKVLQGGFVLPGFWVAEIRDCRCKLVVVS